MKCGCLDPQGDSANPWVTGIPGVFLNLVVEGIGERQKDKEAKTSTTCTLRMPAVNNHGGFGRWVFLEITDPYDDVVELIRATIAQETFPAKAAQ
jgi:type III restriction enzyme